MASKIIAIFNRHKTKKEAKTAAVERQNSNLNSSERLLTAHMIPYLNLNPYKVPTLALR